MSENNTKLNAYGILNVIGPHKPIGHYRENLDMVLHSCNPSSGELKAVDLGV